MSNLNAGNVAITLNGEQRTLKPTLRAIDMISSIHGGLQKTHEAIMNRDFATMVSVIRWGLNLTDSQAKNLREEVWTNGLYDLQAPLMMFVAILSNGGQPLPDVPVEPDAEGNG
jgi:hypothetical protein